MRLTVRREQLDVMAAVAEANFERRLSEHLRLQYPKSIVKLPDGGEFTVGELTDGSLEQLVRVGIAKSRRFGMKLQSSISAFVTLMFDVAPNFDEHRLCSVLLGDEEKAPDDRIEEILNVLSEKNWEAIRKDYDPNEWLERPEPDQTETTEGGEGEKQVADPGPADPMAKTISASTLARTAAKRRSMVDVQPEPIPAEPEIDQSTVRIDRKE